MDERPVPPSPQAMMAATRAAMADEARRRRAAARERTRLIAKANRGGVKHPAGATKATPDRGARRAKAKAGRKAARRNR